MRGNLVYNNIDLEIESKKELSLEKIAFKKYRNNVCEYCGKIIKSWGDKTVDHAVAKARGGIDAPSNWRICCKDCNSSKGMLTELEYKRLLRETANLKKIGKECTVNVALEMVKKSGEINWDEVKNIAINQLSGNLEIVEKQLERELYANKEKYNSIDLNDKIKCYIEDINEIFVAKTIENNFKQLNRENKKINKIINKYNEGNIGLIKLYKGVLLPSASQIYFAYNNILGLKEVKVIDILTEDILSKNERSFLRTEGIIE